MNDHLFIFPFYFNFRLRESIEGARSEGKRSFGDDSLLIEKYFESCRHIEVKKKTLLASFEKIVYLVQLFISHGYVENCIIYLNGFCIFSFI